MTTILRTGIDLIEVNRLAEMRPELRERFKRRAFTDAELKICEDNDQRLSGRFACKEAVSKVLGTGIFSVSLHEIEILQTDNSAPCVVLHGEAKRIADELGLTVWSVSITHLKDYASAVAVATGE